MRIKINKDCCCEHHLYECSYQKVAEKKFAKGETFKVENQFTNESGTFYRIRLQDKVHDISKHNCDII